MKHIELIDISRNAEFLVQRSFPQKQNTLFHMQINSTVLNFTLSLSSSLEFMSFAALIFFLL